jgi:Tol biopolymer transport system component/predicted Ser/Thr protein kinase
MIGRTIDRYRVVEQLGQGGMGVVYKARDTMLDRFVALKVLPPDVSSDPDRRRRFLHEAKSASALNHPGIVSVFDLLSVDGQDVLVMELIEGQTLADLLVRRRLPPAEALGLAVRIADAVARAHAAGIVHRDLKPSNIMVTTDGVKVLDFGLAKIADAPFQDTEAPTAAPDERSLTRERIILGTIPWMSPEQAAGRTVDARSDIFSFGVIVYEMLTGTHPFRRATTIETLTAIREAEPEPPTRLVPTLPPEVDRAVLRCLHKEPAKRWQSLSDLGTVLQDLKEDSESGRRVIVEAAGPQNHRKRWPWLAAAGVVAIAAIAAALILMRAHPPETGGLLEVHRLTYDGGYSVMPGISADGKLIAYASDRSGDGQTDIWVRHINRPEPARLTDHPADDLQPRFSPDGSQVVFRSERDGGGVYIVNTLGGETRKLASDGIFPRFSPDGRRIVYMSDTGVSATGLFAMYEVPVDGGEPQPFLPGFGAAPPPTGYGPVWSPDGSRVLFTGAPLEDLKKRDWWVVPVDGGEPISSGAMQSLPKIDLNQFPCVWLPDRVLFVAGSTIEGTNLYSASISTEGRIEGPVETLTSGPGMMWTPSVSEDGRVAFSKFQWMVRLWVVEIDPGSGRTTGEPRLVTADASQKFGVALAVDAPLLAFSTFFGSPEKRQAELRLHDLESGWENVVASTVAKTISLSPRLSVDGSLLAWNEIVDRQPTAFIAKTADSSPHELCRGCMVMDFFANSPEALVLQLPNRLVRRSLVDASEVLVLEPDELEIYDVDLSRDDRWLAVRSVRPDGRRALHVIAVRDPPPPPGEWIEIAPGENWVSSPHWSHDDRLLYYLSIRDDFNCIWAQPLDPLSKRPVGDELPILHAHRSNMKIYGPRRGMAFELSVGTHYLAFNAAEQKGEIYTAILPQAR